jgi:DNA-binding beta-propeller fold protein YncE
MSGSGRPRLDRPQRRRPLARVALLFAVTAGVYWPLWLAQVMPLSRSGPPATRGRIAIGIAALVPGLNVLLEVLVALFLPRAVRRLGESRGKPVADTEVQTFLLLAAPAVAIALALALGLPAWLVGYLAWPLELPAALVVQRALNRVEPPAPARPDRLDGELIAGGVIAAALVVGVVLAVVLSGDDEQGQQRSQGATQSERFSDVAVTSRALWVTRIEDNAVAELDRATLRPTGRSARVGRSPYDIAAGLGGLWVADYRNDSVSRIDPQTARAKGPLIPTGRGPFGVAVGYGFVWVTNEVDRNLVRIDPAKSRVTKKVTVGLGPRGVETGEGAVWVAGAGSSSVVRVDPRSGAKMRIPMPSFCQDVAVGGGSAWAVLPEVNAVVRIDSASGQRTGGLISVGIGPVSIDYGRGSVWVANGSDGTVTRIEASTGRVVGAARPMGDRLSDIAVSGSDVYVLRADGVVRHIRAR